MATLDERLYDEEYRHWVKAAICLQYTKDGLVPLADQKSQELHSDVLKQLRSNGNPSVNGICPNPRINFKTRVIQCCVSCQAYLVEASRHFTGPGALFLKNSDITNLPKQHWQIAKLFMNAGQDASNSDPSQTDISGILNFIDHCDLAKAAIQNTNYVTQVRDTRNRILHNPDMKITKHDFSTNITPALIDLLQDPLYLLNNPAAQAAVIKIKQVQSSSFHISKNDEIQALKDMLVEHNKDIQGLDTVVRGINASLLDLKTKMNDSEETTGKEISKVHRNLSRELEEQKTEIQTEIQKVQISIECLKNKIKDDNELQNLMRDQVTEMLKVPFKDIKDQVQSQHQEFERLKNRLDSIEKKTTELQQERRGLKRRLDIEEKKTTESQQERRGLKRRLDIEEKKTTELQQKQRGLKRHLDMEEKKTTVELGTLNARVDNLDSKMDDMQNLQEPSTTVSLEDELELQQYLRDGYKETRLQVPTLPDCYTSPVSKIFAPVVILKENKSSLKASGALKQNKQDPKRHGKGEEQDQKIRSYKTMFYENDILQKQNFLLGKAGVGKSTFCKHLVDIWCNASQSPYYDDAGWLEQLKFVFHVEFRHASESESVFDMICNQLIDRDSLKVVAKHVLNTKPDKCLVIGDGLDEWKGSATQSAKTSYDIPGLPSTIDLHKCVMLTTSRPWRVHALSQRVEQAGRVFELLGIDNVKTLTTNILIELQVADPEQACETFLQSVKTSYMDQLVQIPLMLINVLTVWHMHKSLNPSICVNYSYMVEALFQRAKGESHRCGDKNRLTETTVRGLSRQESDWADSACSLPGCFQNTDICKGHAGLIIKLGNLAFDLLLREKHEQSLVFSKHETMRYLNEKELEVCLTVGILSQSQVPGRGIQKMDKLCFCHKTFQEFLGSLWLSIKYLKNRYKFYECCKTLDDVFDYNVFVQFLCGFSPSAGKMFWQYIVNEVIEKDANIQKMRLNDIVAFDSIYNLCLLVLACTEEARHSYQENQKLYYFIPDLCFDIDFTEQQQTVLYNLLHENIENIKSVKVYGKERCLQIVASVNKMTEIVCIRLCTETTYIWSDYRPVLSSGSKESPMLELPQQIRSLSLKRWTIKGLRNNLPMHLTALTFVELTLTHHDIEQLGRWLAEYSGLVQLELNTLSCSDHSERGCLTELDLQQHHNLRKLKLAKLSVGGVMLPVQPKTCLREMRLHELTLTHHVIEQMGRCVAEYWGLEWLELGTLSCSDHGERGCLTELDLQKHRSLEKLTLAKLSFGNVILPVQPETCLRNMKLLELTLTHHDIQQLCRCSAEYSGLKQLELNTISCSDHSESCCLIELDLQKRRSLEKLTLEKLSVVIVLLSVQSETCLRNLKLLELTLTHHGIQQLCRWLAEYSGLKQLGLNSLSCSDHSERGCLTELDLQQDHSLRNLTLAKLSVLSVMLPVQPESCLMYMHLHKLTLTHHDIEQLGRWLAEYSGLEWLELGTLSCSDHGERGCLTELDLQKHRSLETLILKKLSVGSVILPVQPEPCLMGMKLHELTLTHHGIEQMGRCVAEYSGLKRLELDTLSCSDHVERDCLTELDLQKHRSLEKLILEKLSVGSVILPVQPEPCLMNMQLHELTLTHHDIEQLGRCVGENSGLKMLELVTLSCSDHVERGCLTELDLQKHRSLWGLILAKLSVGSVILPVQPEPFLRYMTLHELTLTHHDIEQLGRCVGEYSDLKRLELDTLSCSDHVERGCLTELDLQKHRSLELLILEKLSVGSVILPVQPEPCLMDMKLHELTLTHHDIEQLGRCVGEYSGLKMLELNTLSCSDHVESGCLTELDLQKHRSLEKLILEKLSVGSVILPVHQEPCLRNMKLHELTLTHHGIEQMGRCVGENSGLKMLELVTLSCSDHVERGCLTELDLQKHRSLEKLILEKLSVGSVILPVQPEPCLMDMKLHELTLTHHDIEQLGRCVGENSGLKMLELNTLSCSDHVERGCLTELDLQKHRSLEKMILEKLSVGSVILPVQQEPCLRNMKLHELTLTHHGIEQLGRCVGEYSGLKTLELDTLSCSDHVERDCLTELDLQKHRSLEKLKLEKLSVGSVILPVQPEPCLMGMKLDELTLTHHDIEQLGRCVGEYSDLKRLELVTLSCSDHVERGCLTELDLQKHRSLETLILEKLSVGSVILPVQPEPCLMGMKLHELTLTHHDIEQLGRCVGEYSGLKTLELDTLFCSDHVERGCLTELDLQKHRSLEKLILEKLSVGSVILPVQPEPCLMGMKLHELTLTHHDIEQLGRCVGEYSGLKRLELDTLSCSDHVERDCLTELDLQKHRSLEKLTLEKLSVGSVILPVQQVPCLRNMKLHELTLTHHDIEQLGRCVGENSGLETLELVTLSCSDHVERGCLTELDLQKHRSLWGLILAKLSVGSVILPVQPEPFLRYMTLHELTLIHHDIEQLGRCVGEYSDLKRLELVTLSCSDHVERGCLTELDLQKHRSLETLILEKLSVGSVILPVQPEPCLMGMKLHELTLTHHDIEQLGRCVGEYSGLKTLELDTLFCSDHVERGCLTELDLQKHRSLEKLILEKLSVGSVILPVQPEPCLMGMKLHELTLTHHDIEQLGRCVGEYSGLKRLELDTLSCSDHVERGCLTELDLQKHRSLWGLILAKLSVGSVILPVQPEPFLRYMTLHELTLTHHDIEQLGRCVAEYSGLKTLELDTLSCSDHVERDCLTELDLQKHRSLE